MSHFLLIIIDTDTRITKTTQKALCALFFCKKQNAFLSLKRSFFERKSPEKNFKKMSKNLMEVK